MGLPTAVGECMGWEHLWLHGESRHSHGGAHVVPAPTAVEGCVCPRSYRNPKGVREHL